MLSVLGECTVRRPKEVYQKVATQLGISADDQDELLPSGAMSRYRNRILWALHYMKRAGVVTSPGRGLYVISDRGRALLADAVDVVASQEERVLVAHEEMQDYIAAEILDHVRTV